MSTNYAYREVSDTQVAEIAAHRVRSGRLHRLHQGVYAVGHRPPSPYARAMAAVLACGPGAVLSHSSAAALWNLGRWRTPLEVTARNARRHEGVRVHRSRTLTLHDVTRHYGIPTTTPARTLKDLARVLDPASLTRALNDARLRHLIRSDDATTGPTRSVFEDAFLAFVTRHGLPRPDVNQHVAGYEVDMLRRPPAADRRARRPRLPPRQFEEDREREATLAAAGFRVQGARGRTLQGAARLTK